MSDIDCVSLYYDKGIEMWSLLEYGTLDKCQKAVDRYISKGGTKRDTHIVKDYLSDRKADKDRIDELEKSKLEYMNAMAKERKRHNDRDMSDLSTQEKIRNYFEEWAKLLRIRTSHEKWWDITEKEQFERIKERILLLKVTEMKYDFLQTAHSNREVDIDSQATLITDMMEWIDDKYKYYDNRHSDVEYAIFLILEEFKEQFEQKAKDIKDR